MFRGFTFLILSGRVIIKKIFAQTIITISNKEITQLCDPFAKGLMKIYMLCKYLLFSSLVNG